MEKKKSAGAGNATDGEMNRVDCRCQKENGNLRQRSRRARDEEDIPASSENLFPETSRG